MKRFYLTETQFNSSTVDGEEFNHIKNVMRLKKCDRFIAFFGSEKDFEVEITDIKKDCLTIKVINELSNSSNPNIKIDLFQSLAKGDKLELITQKVTEIGVSTIYPLFVKNCDVKPNTTKTSRLDKIIINACKQCGRSILTKVNPIIEIDECLNILTSYDLVLFANETEEITRIYDVLNKHKSATKIALIIGPEGGFTPEEIDKLKQVSTSVSFGKRILRTETASIYLSSIINDFYRN